MLSKNERKAEQAPLALYAAALCAEFCINLKLITTADAKFGFRLKCRPVKWRQLGWRHHFSRRHRLNSLVHICDSTTRFERIIDVWHELWFLFTPSFFKVEYKAGPPFASWKVHLLAEPDCEFSQCHIGSRKGE